MFVCTGNICRSPMAEAVFQWLVDAADLSDHFKIESSGTSDWHVGERPHVGTRKILKKNNIPLDPEKRAQLLRKRDYEKCDYVLVMDDANMRSLRWHGDRAERLLEFASRGKDYGFNVPDPYYSGGFELVYDLILDSCRGLLKQIREDHNI